MIAQLPQHAGKMVRVVGTIVDINDTMLTLRDETRARPRHTLLARARARRVCGGAAPSGRAAELPALPHAARAQTRKSRWRARGTRASATASSR